MVTLKPKHLYFYCLLRWTATSHAEGRCVTGALRAGSNYKNIALKEREGARECVFKKGFYFQIKPESLKSFFTSPFAPAEQCLALQRVPVTRGDLTVPCQEPGKAEGIGPRRFTRPSVPRWPANLYSSQPNPCSGSASVQGKDPKPLPIWTGEKCTFWAKPLLQEGALRAHGGDTARAPCGHQELFRACSAWLQPLPGAAFLGSCSISP